MGWLRGYIYGHLPTLLTKDIKLARVLGAPAGFTLSGWFWLLEQKGSKLGKALRKLTDFLAWVVFQQKQHCWAAYLNDKNRV